MTMMMTSDKPATYAVGDGGGGLETTERYLQHVNLTTAERRQSRRVEVDDSMIAQLRPTLEAAQEGPQRIPGIVRPCTLEVLRYSKCLLVVVSEAENRRLMSIGVAAHSRCAPSLWDSLTDTQQIIARGLTRPNATPWCATRLEAAAALYDPTHAILAELADLEVAIAWTFLDERA
jgi:hypothetical protein